MAAPDSTLIIAPTAAGGATSTELAWVAPTSVTAPTDAHTPLTYVSASWEGMGYVKGDDGVTIAADEAAQEFKAFAMSTPVRVVNTKSSDKLTIVFMETNLAVLDVYNRLALGTTTTNASGDWSVSRGTVPTQRYAFCIDAVDGSNYMRYFYPSVEVVERGERKIADGTQIEYRVVLQAYPDSTGEFVYEYGRTPSLATS